MLIEKQVVFSIVFCGFLNVYKGLLIVFYSVIEFFYKKYPEKLSIMIIRDFLNLNILLQLEWIPECYRIGNL